MSDLFAPEGGWRVRILDLSGASDDKLVEEVGGFPTLMQANAFARAYVRDSVERCRRPGPVGAGGAGCLVHLREDAEITGNPDGAWRSANELADFAARAASEEDRDWRVLDPRRLEPGGRRMKLRFAPSPTGLLHVGNVRAALANYLLARRHDARFLLRFDDTDTGRNRPEYAGAIEQDLRWLGIAWDESFRQSDRLEVYEAAARRLEAAGRLYPCFESEAELQAKRDQRQRRHLPPTYDRAMLKLTPEQRAAAEAGGKKPYWRFRLSDGAVAWHDMVLGDKQVKLATLSDPVLVRADGTPLYTFTSVVDDLEYGITHIVRGEDHVTNTAVQLDLWSALGGNPTRVSFAHLPLLVGDDGGKLSKRTGALSLRSLRQDGVEPTAITAFLARLGTSDDPVPCDMAQLAAEFELAKFSRNSPRFDVRQLLALNRRVLHALPFETVQDRLPPGATPAFWDAVRGNLDMLSEARGWWDVVAGTIIPPVVEGDAPFLRDALAALPPEPWDSQVWVTWTEALKAASGRKGRALFHPLRLALTGEERGPEMKGLLPLMGRPRAVERLHIAQA